MTDEKKSKEPKPKALGAMEKRQLAQLVDNDFDVLEREMDQLANEMTRIRHQEIEAEFAERTIDQEGLRQEWTEMAARWRTEYNEWAVRVREAGLSASARRTHELLLIGDPTFEIRGLDAAKRQVEQDVKLQMNRAKTGLQRNKVDAHRKILLSGLQDEATAILSSMPDPRQLVLDSMQQARDTRLALMAGRPAEPAPEAAAAQTGEGRIAVGPEVIEGLVTQRVENMADRGRVVDAQ